MTNKLNESYLFTSESVGEGHPDKVCDQISDSILDEILRQDPHSRVACETLATSGLVVVAGEITSNAKVDYESVVRSVLKEIGYTDPAFGIDSEKCEVLVRINKQSPDISQGVSAGEGLFKEQGAGDQGMMFGYANNETPELMPAAILYSHQMLNHLNKLRKDGTASFLRPDSKGQVTVEYKDGKLHRVDAVVVSTQHDPDVSHDKLKKFVIDECVKKVIPAELLDNQTKYYINPTGRFVLGGPEGDCGLTGRKIIVDTYGGYGAHGGGAFSGKDPTKVDRSAAYAARYIAKNIVAAGFATECLVQLAYAIGVAEPISVFVDTFGATDRATTISLQKAVREIFPVKPADIIKQLDLLRPIYKQTASYGHFGKQYLPWEKSDKIDALKAMI